MPLFVPCVFPANPDKMESRRADSNRLPAPATSLLAYMLARTSASGKCACLGGFRRSGSLTLSILYQCVSARLQYGLQYLRGRDELMRQWSIHDPVYRSKTQHVGVCHRVWMRQGSSLTVLR